MSRLRLLAGSVLLVACEPSKATPPTAAPPTTAAAPPPATPAAAPAPCPTDDRLRTLAARTGGRPDAIGLRVRCVPLQVGGQPRWFVDALWPEPDGAADTVTTLRALLTPAGDAEWRELRDDLPSSYAATTEPPDLQTVDLDGDGSDELAEVTAAAGGGGATRGLQLYRVRARGLTPLLPDGGLTLDEDNSAWTDEPDRVVVCAASYRFDDDPPGRRLVLSYAGRCARAGTVAWRLQGDRMVEVAR